MGKDGDFDDCEENPKDGPGLIDLDMGQFGSGTMNDPLRHAMGMRSAQDKCKMRLWDSFPTLFQNTIFHGEQDDRIKTLRHGGTLQERLAYAKELKGTGNDALKAAGATSSGAAPSSPRGAGGKVARELEGHIQKAQEAIVEKERELKEMRHELKQLKAELDCELSLTVGRPAVALGLQEKQEKGLESAITSYEKAAGLFRFVECVRPDWKNDDGSYKGIEDEHLVVDSEALEGLEGDNPAEVAEAKEVCTSCYLNIALASQKLGKFDQMKFACDEVLTHVNPESVKALYRRAQARVAPVGALDADRDLAIQDLQAAAQIEAQNKDVRGMLSKLKAEKKAKESAERSTFAGLFDRGSVVNNDPRTEGDKPQDPKNWDLRNPEVQRFLDINPGPAGFMDP